MRTINLKPYETNALALGTKTQLRRVMKPQLRDDGMGRDSVPDCPIAKVGEQLRVREPWSITTGTQPGDLGAAVRYHDGHVRAVTMDTETALPLGLSWGRWRSSMHMPAWASRFILTVTAVRTQRVRDITEDEAAAEGFDGCCAVGYLPNYIKGPKAYHFAAVWSDTYEGAWAANAWCWVLEFTTTAVPDIYVNT